MTTEALLGFAEIGNFQFRGHLLSQTVFDKQEFIGLRVLVVAVEYCIFFQQAKLARNLRVESIGLVMAQSTAPHSQKLRSSGCRCRRRGRMDFLLSVRHASR